MYGKWTDSVVSWCLLLSVTNPLAYYGIRTLRIRNVFIVQAPVAIPLKIVYSN